MVWLRVCSASIGVPAAMRPITGPATGRLPSSSEPTPELRTLPRVPSMTLGVKPRRPFPLPLDESSGSLITSMARARLGRRRMKPRSSSAVIRRWIPDVGRGSSASFISSKEGGTPDSFRRSLMNRRSAYFLRVSISINPQFAFPGLDGVVRFGRLEFKGCGVRVSHLETPASETNHERTLYVPYVFRNHLISRQRARAYAGTGRSGVRRGAAGCRKLTRRLLPAQMVHGSQAPVPQRDFQAARSPDDRPAWRSGRLRRALQAGRADSLRADRW